MNPKEERKNDKSLSETPYFKCQNHDEKESMLQFAAKGSEKLSEDVLDVLRRSISEKGH